MQYDVNSGVLQVVIEGEEINAVVGESARIDVGTAIDYIKTGQAEIEEAVQEGISDFNDNATSKTNDFNDNASTKTTDFNTNASNKTSSFNENYTEKLNDFNSNASDKTTDFNDNYTAKKGLIDAQVVIAEGAATTATNQAGLAKQWAVGDPSEPVGNSSKYWAEYAESIAQTIGDPANKDLSNLSTTGNNRFVNLQQQIDAIVASSDVFDIVGTYAELQAYDISTVPVNDIIKVLVDSTHSGAATYYRCIETAGVKSWSYIGSEGAYYTKGEADNKFSTIPATGSSLDYTGNTLSLENAQGTVLSSVTIQSSPDLDNKSITKNTSQELQTIGVIDSNNTTNAIKTWTGTKAQYNAIVTKDPNTLYNITDDTDVSLTILEALYPVGSIYITTASSCPLATLISGSTWTLVSSGRVLQGASSGHAAGTTIEAGLPEHRHIMFQNGGNNADITATSFVGSSRNTGGSAGYTMGQITSDVEPSLGISGKIYNSTIYGNSTTVQPPAYVVNIFRRTA